MVRASYTISGVYAATALTCVGVPHFACAVVAACTNASIGSHVLLLISWALYCPDWRGNRLPTCYEFVTAFIEGAVCQRENMCPQHFEKVEIVCTGVRLLLPQLHEQSSELCCKPIIRISTQSPTSENEQVCDCPRYCRVDACER
jgi:hypothetical protein